MYHGKKDDGLENRQYPLKWSLHSMPRPILEFIYAQSLIIWSLNSILSGSEPEGPRSISLVQLVQLPPVFQQWSQTKRKGSSLGRLDPYPLKPLYLLFH